jgi:hypothetical protein
MHILRKTVEERDDMGGEFGGSFVEFGSEGVHLLFGGYFRGEEQPNERFEKWFSISSFARVGWKYL